MTTVQFRLLGDVQAGSNGRLIELGHARQQCVLVALLVDANRVVSTDELIDRVWGQQAPQRGRNALYTYISRLRQALAVSDKVRVVRRPTGYLLTVDPHIVDLHQFRNLVHQARAADATTAALTLHEQALALWRGEAFGALDTPWLANVREDLHRQRLAAELRRNDLTLDLGRHADLLATLPTTAAAYPLDERLAAQLMLTLYRSGRQADALAHYHRLRQRLADELGTDPTPALQQLYQQILTTDPTLTAPTRITTRSTTAMTVPRQLPAPPRSFAGRVDELAHLDAFLTPDTGEPRTAVIITAVSGTAGIGKTALAVHWAHRRIDRFPDGQLYVNLRGFDPTGAALEPATVVRSFLDALGIPPHRIPADPEAQSALYRSQLTNRRMLVVLDNARNSAQVRPLLPGAPCCQVLVTSRNQLTGLIATDDAHPLALDLLTTEEARELLARRLGADRIAAEPEAVDAIITRCARLPLALTIVVARAALQPHTELHRLAEELRDSQHRWDTLTGDDPTTDVQAVFSWSYQALTPHTARLFRLLGLYPGPDIAAAATASLTGLPTSTIRPLLAELTQASLLVEHTPGRYTFHDLLRAYATDLAQRIDPDQQRHAATHRILDHYLHTAHTAAWLLDPTRDPITLSPPTPGVTPQQPADYQQALNWFMAEHAVLLAAVEHAAATGFDTHTGQLTWALVTFLERQGHWHDQAAAGRTAVTAARLLADPTVQSRAHHTLAHAYTLLGRFDDSHTQLSHALDLATQTGDQTAQAHVHNSLSYLWERRGNYPQALDHARQALTLHQATGHQHGQAYVLNQVGWCHALLGDYQQALTACQQALTLLQELDDRDGQARTWDSLGYAHHHLSHHTQALTCYQHALTLSREIGDRHNEAETLNHLGNTHHATGNDQAAHDAWQQALTILDDLHHPDADQLRTKLAGLDPHSP